MADRMAVLDAGRVVQMGAPDEIYRNPLSSHVAGFIGETNLIESTVDRIVRDDEELGVSVSSDAGQFIGRVTRNNWRPADGSKVLVSIRPEALYVDDSGVPTNRIQGKILDRMYLGSNIQYRVCGAGEHLWSVTETNPHMIREDGDDIMLTADPKDVTILKV